MQNNTFKVIIFNYICSIYVNRNQKLMSSFRSKWSGTSYLMHIPNSHRKSRRGLLGTWHLVRAVIGVHVEGRWVPKCFRNPHVHINTGYAHTHTLLSFQGLKWQQGLSTFSIWSNGKSKTHTPKGNVSKMTHGVYILTNTVNKARTLLCVCNPQNEQFVPFSAKPTDTICLIDVPSDFLSFLSQLWMHSID